MKMKKVKKYMKPGSISSYLKAQQKQVQVQERDMSRQFQKIGGARRRT